MGKDVSRCSQRDFGFGGSGGGGGGMARSSAGRVISKVIFLESLDVIGVDMTEVLPRLVMFSLGSRLFKIMTGWWQHRSALFQAASKETPECISVAS